MFGTGASEHNLRCTLWAERDRMHSGAKHGNDGRITLGRTVGGSRYFARIAAHLPSARLQAGRLYARPELTGQLRDECQQEAIT